MTRIIATALAIFAGGLAAASDDATPDAATRDAIESKLAGQGYDVRRIEAEDGMYEAYALKDGERYEIHLDGDLDIVRSERDD